MNDLIQATAMTLEEVKTIAAENYFAKSKHSPYLCALIGKKTKTN
jgi:hypothetical protein